MAQADLPTRTERDSKMRGGKCLVIAGSRGMFGAAVLCATAAARVGAGYTYIHAEGHFPTVKHPDFLIASSLRSLSLYQAIAIGPGLQNQKKVEALIKKFLKLNIPNLVLDAGALNVLAKFKKPLLKTWIVTPHEGELSRILDVPATLIRRDRKRYVVKAQQKLGCTVLLKGHRTLVATAGGLWEIRSGNPALAKAGTGDVLTGMILGFLSQKMEPVSAALLGAFVHGFVADHWVQKKQDQLSLLASDITNLIPFVLHQLR